MLAERKKTALYARLSKDDLEDVVSNSIIHQKFMLEKYAEEHGYYNTQFYADDGYTGVNFNRPAFQEMMDDIRKGKIERVIVKDFSRFGRNYVDCGRYVDYEFATYNVQFISIGENFNSENGDRIMMGLFNLINELYAQDISRKQRAAIRAKGESGKHVTTRPIYGYRTDPQDKSHWIIDEDAAEVVRFIFTMYLSGHGFSEIADMLHDKKVLCPSAYRGKIRKGSSAQTDPYTWNGRTIADILSKQEYCGDTVNFRTERKSYKDKRVIFKPDSELVIHQNTQTAIVSRADYEAVQEKLSQKKKYVRNRERPILDGKVFCYDCKCKMYLMRKKQKGGIYNVYVCNNYRKKKNQTCSSHYIPEKTILQELKKLLYQILQEYENDKKTFLRKLRYLLRAKCSSELMAARSECEKVENRIREVSDYKKSAYADKLSKRITDEFFDSIMFSMDEETIQLKSKYEECQHVLCAAEEKIKGADLFCRRLNQFSLESLNEISETAVNSLVDRIEIREENELGKKSVLLDFYLVGIGKILS